MNLVYDKANSILEVRSKNLAMERVKNRISALFELYSKKGTITDQRQQIIYSACEDVLGRDKQFVSIDHPTGPGFAKVRC